MSKEKLEQALTATFALNYGLRYFVEDGLTWWVAVDVAKILDLTNIRKNLAEFPDDEKKKFDILTAVTKTDVRQNVKQTVRDVRESVWCINEPGLYHLIFMSRKPEAEKLKRWVFHEVLPSIRKYGYYVAPQEKIITIEGRENYNKFKAQYPEGVVKLLYVVLDTEEFEDGREIDHFYFKVVVNKY